MCLPSTVILSEVRTRMKSTACRWSFSGGARICPHQSLVLQHIWKLTIIDRRFFDSAALRSEWQLLFKHQNFICIFVHSYKFV